MCSKLNYTISIKLKSINKNSLEFFKKRLINSLNMQNSCKIRSINMPISIKKYNVLRSPHVNKKARDSFEIRYYIRLIILKNCNSNDDVSKIYTLLSLFNMADVTSKIRLKTCFSE